MYKAIHRPVLAAETLRLLAPDVRSDALFVDATTGEGGHTELFLSSCPRLTAIALDADARIQGKAKERLACFLPRVTFVRAWFDEFFANYPFERRPDIILFDLGISIFHYERSGGGFSFSKDEPLDMRLDSSNGKSAADLIGGLDERELADLIFRYGEERYSRSIAPALQKALRNGRLKTARAAAEVIAEAVPPAYRRGHLHPATKSFQALRMAVNDEPGRLVRALNGAFSVLNPGGVLGVISFHSLEDRAVKQFMKTKVGERHSVNKYRPSPQSVAVEGELLTPKPVSADAAEIKENPPSRSAKLRVIRKKKDEVE